MIRDGDRILLGLSGGKDSLSLLHTLHHLQQKAPVKFELLACTVDPQSDQFDPSPLTPYLAELGVPYFLESQPIMVEAQKTLTRIPTPTAPTARACGAASSTASRANRAATSSRWRSISTISPRR